MATAVATQPVAPQATAPAPAVPGPQPQSCSLYVGELLADVTEAMLYDKFNAVGPVASIRVCRDAVTRRSLGYAYVNFTLPNDAERALDTLNFEPINGKPCRIMWCQRDPSIRRSGVGNIFIKGLERSIDNKSLYDTFSQFGNILSVKVVTDATGQSLGRGFVHFETAEAADSAIANVNGMLLKDKKVTVQHFKSRKERVEEYGKTEQLFRNVFIKNLPEETTKESLEAMFNEFGNVTSCVIMQDDSTGSSKGFGFVAFADAASAKAAVEGMNNKEFNGKPIYVARAQKKAERAAALRRQFEARRKEMQQRSRGVNLYIKNLEDNVDDDKLRNIFAEFGNITSAKVMRDERKNSRGFGFVCFSGQDEATRAVTEMNGRMIGAKPLYVAIAQPREERRQQLSAQHRQRLQMARGGMLPTPNMYPQNMMYMPPMYAGRVPYGSMRPPYMPRQPYMGQPGANFPARPPMQPGQAPNAMYPRQPRGGAPAGGPGARGPAQPGAPTAGGPKTRQTALRSQARNVPTGDVIPPQEQAAGQTLASLLASADPNRQKQILGDNLYPLVARVHPATAGKLTGMLLQMDNSDLLHLLEDDEALNSEIAKANEVLQQHQQTA